MTGPRFLALCLTALAALVIYGLQDWWRISRRWAR